MLRILLLMVLISYTYAEDYALELDAFGKSYHANRSYDWRETNPGLGITFAYADSENADIFASIGSYRDSYDKQAKYVYVGLRGIIGERQAYHLTLSLAGGYLDGSGNDGPSIAPIISFGYNWLDLCATIDPFTKNETRYDSRGNATTTSKMIGVFLKFRALTF